MAIDVRHKGHPFPIPVTVSEHTEQKRPFGICSYVSDIMTGTTDILCTDDCQCYRLGCNAIHVLCYIELVSVTRV